MRGALLIALAACNAGDAVRPDGAVTVDAETADASLWPENEPPDIWNRRINRVLVTDDHVYWSHGQDACHLESPCLDDGPGMTVVRRSNGNVSIHQDGGVGTRYVAQGADALFYVTGLDRYSMYVVKEGVFGEAMSLPRVGTAGPALDATHVYWADRPITTQDFTLRRARQDGDGSDAEVLATLPFLDGGEIIHAGGYLWWGGLQRIPVTGGPIENIASIPYAMAIAAGDNAVFVGSRYSTSSRQELAIHRVDVDGTMTTLVQQDVAITVKPPRYLTVAEGRVWWSQDDNHVYNVSVDGGPVETIDVGEDGDGAFAVLPFKLLVQLGFASYREIPR